MAVLRRDRSGAAAPAVPTGGWAARSLDRSLRRAILWGTALWQLVMIVAVWAAPEADRYRTLLVAMHIGLVIVVLLVEHSRAPVGFVVTGLGVAAVVDWSVARSIDGVLCLATAWMNNLAHLVPSMLMRGRASRVASLVCGLGVPVGLLLVQPDWPITLATAALVTGAAIRKAGRSAVPLLDSYAHRVDELASDAERERQRAAAARSLSQRSAEQARTLHDTVVNTLAAVASGGAALVDGPAVRDRCRRDAQALQALLDGRDLRTDVAAVVTFGAGLGLTVDRRGLDDDALESSAHRLPDSVVDAVCKAAQEALVNVAKHAGTNEARVEVTDDGEAFSISVTDHGSGFDGQLVPSRGLAESVVARCAEAGVSATVASRPGAGTTVTMRYHRPRPEVPESIESAPVENFMDSVATIRWRACWLWIVAIVVVGVFIEAVNRFGLVSPAFAMLAVVAPVALLCRPSRARRPLGPALAGLVIASIPIAFLLALAAVDFGRREAFQWQAMGVTAPLVGLLVMGRTRVPVILGLLALVGTAAAASVTVAQDGSTEAAAVIVIGTAVALVVMAGWAAFQRAVEYVGRRAAADQQMAAQARLERVRHEAAMAARARWHRVGMTQCLAMLRGLAAGVMDPADPTVQAACADEQEYLRQVMMLSPKLVRSGQWFVASLAQARTRGVHLEVRSGDHDVEDDEVASVLGRLL